MGERLIELKGIAKTYGRRGAEVVERNQAAVDNALDGLHRVELPDAVSSERGSPPIVPDHAPDFVRTVTAAMMAGRGDELPVSAMPVDGTYPSGTTKYEKRNISELVAVWDEDLCIQCGNCSFVCPHSVIRSNYYDPAALESAPEGFRSAPLNAPAIRARLWSIAATWPFSASICGTVAGSSAPTATPQAEHCTSVSLRVSPIGVNSASSKLCPPHLPQVDIAISLSPDRIA